MNSKPTINYFDQPVSCTGEELDFFSSLSSDNNDNNNGNNPFSSSLQPKTTQNNAILDSSTLHFVDKKELNPPLINPTTIHQDIDNNNDNNNNNDGSDHREEDPNDKLFISPTIHLVNSSVSSSINEEEKPRREEENQLIENINSTLEEKRVSSSQEDLSEDNTQPMQMNETEKEEIEVDKISNSLPIMEEELPNLVPTDESNEKVEFKKTILNTNGGIAMRKSSSTPLFVESTKVDYFAGDDSSSNFFSSLPNSQQLVQGEPASEIQTVHAIHPSSIRNSTGTLSKPRKLDEIPSLFGDSSTSFFDSLAGSTPSNPTINPTSLSSISNNPTPLGERNTEVPHQVPYQQEKPIFNSNAAFTPPPSSVPMKTHSFPIAPFIPPMDKNSNQPSTPPRTQEPPKIQTFVPFQGGKSPIAVPPFIPPPIPNIGSTATAYSSQNIVIPQPLPLTISHTAPSVPFNPPSNIIFTPTPPQIPFTPPVHQSIMPSIPPVTNINSSILTFTNPPAPASGVFVPKSTMPNTINSPVAMVQPPNLNQGPARFVEFQPRKLEPIPQFSIISPPIEEPRQHFHTSNSFSSPLPPNTSTSYHGTPLQPISIDFSQAEKNEGSSFSNVSSVVSPNQTQFSEIAKNDPAFRKPHPITCFGFDGKIIVMFPRQHQRLNAFEAKEEEEKRMTLGPIRILNLSKVLTNTDYAKGFNSFPGPLNTNGSKEKAVRYLKETILKIESLPDYDERTHMGNRRKLLQLLIVLLDHCGVIGGQEGEQTIQDIQQLLKQDSNLFSLFPLMDNRKIPTEEREKQLTKQVEILVSEGKKEEALSISMENGLWTIALLLASNCGPDAFKNAIIAFTNQNLVEGSPLRTMSLLFCGKPQEIFSTSESGLLDRWQENLVTLLANGIKNKGVIGTLGDKLWSIQRKVEAAHFCYMLADHDFEYFDNPHSRLVLLGADHKTKPRNFINGEAIRCSEIVEYSKSLANPQFNIPQLQVYKYIYATMLCEIGLVEQAKRYISSIESNINRNRSTFNYNPLFLMQLDHFKNRMNTLGGNKPSASSFSFGGLLSKFISSSDETGVPPPGSVPRNASFPSLLSTATFNNTPTSSLMNKSSSLQDNMNVLQQERPQSIASHSIPKPNPTTSLPPPENNSHPSISTKPRDLSGTPANAPNPIKPSESKESVTPTKSGSSILGKIFSPFSWVGKGNAVVADLGEENEFEWNEEYKTYLRKGQKPDPSLLASLAPPPIFSSLPPSAPSTAPPSVNLSAPPLTTTVIPPLSSAPPNSMGLTGDTPLPTPPVSSAASGGRRKRYVDTFNPNESNQSAPSPVKIESVASLLPSQNIFTPQ
eukprot:TRINITY_DN4388_c1_g1_i1.p1 TRINITY_DN4388_c1_g1~~TRINITY_DN4388_c1_g1_i1.p1  ORF type:complete len:1334 (-),score=316.62 TRINITY_DN4388_c1_g1_i1:33-4034(-)